MTVFEVASVRAALEDVADAAAAGPMQAYMKHHFVFFGVKTPARRSATKALLVAARTAPPEVLVGFARTCWLQPEREFQYVGTDVLGNGHRNLDPNHLAAIAELATQKSWWDTIDGLAWPVGSIVQRHPESVATMDDWIDDDNMWIARMAILHQLHRKATTDVDRLFEYALRRGGDSEFFIRKAIGWSLRQYAHIDPRRVAAFVDANESGLSSLTKREALRNIG